ncbi:RagB/SusD family nutrient uptake outer membrane protein [Rhodohalobacter sp. 8-1]|uniref:RagB/SusD family nutrient uptake outer membrane protein n=1 Tax=Rhodohalobacter sp. 8-1 TaxID=3131972 RepID=UPI0030ED18E7
MLNTKFRILAAFALLAMVFGIAVSCTGDLSTTPIDDNITTSANVYESPDDFEQVLAKLYAGFSVTGQQGPAGNADIQGIDEGFSSYIRQLWVHQTLPTEEAIVAWNDPGLPDFNFQSWGSSNDFVMGMYSRIYYEIALTNEFIREAQQRDEAVIQQYLAEARFLRALSYWHGLDMFGGNIPFVTEEDPIGAYQPEPTNADDLFAYIESELLAVADELPAAGSVEYGRASRGAAWTLLAKLYLNSEVYTGTQRYDEALTYAQNVIDQSGYQLADNYDHLFMADNDRPEVSREIIFPIRFDGDNMQTYGGTNFIIHAQIGGNMSAGDFGMDGGWAGHRVTPDFIEILNENKVDPFLGTTTENPDGDPEIYVPGGYQAASGYTTNWTPAEAPPLVSDDQNNVYTGQVYFAIAGAEFKFTAERNWNANWGGANGTLVPDGSNLVIGDAGLYDITVDLNTMTYTVTLIEASAPEFADSRTNIFTDGQSLEIESVQDFNQGYTLTKWSNMTSTGQPGKNLQFADTDFPMFRLADVYLIYAEATVRGATGGDINRAVDLVNELRERAYGDASGNITTGDLNLDFIIDERARELHWEAHRRTDLRRFGQFTGGDYVWSWKGETQEGAPTAETFDIFPIPSTDINSNLNLTQNPGY